MTSSAPGRKKTAPYTRRYPRHPMDVRMNVQVSMEFPLPLSPYPLKLRAIVRYRIGLHYGFEFLTPTPEQRASLDRVCQMLAAGA